LNIPLGSDNQNWRSLPELLFPLIRGARFWRRGFPGYATPAINESVSTFVLCTMFAKVARDQMSAAEAARSAEVELQHIFDRWK
jgi:multiple sugar transport system substrate-binding protein